jgi:hypothetical protein
MAMSQDGAELAEIARRYERFASAEARGSSPLYESLAVDVARSPDLLAFLAALPTERRQPNLFFGAVRHLGGLPENGRTLADFLKTDGIRVSEIMLARTTQTNEPARCAVLLPALAGLRQPLALIEVGASAGLCLLGDRYGYDYGAHQIAAPKSLAAIAPIFTCVANASTPLPEFHPEIVWRAGLDLNPLDVNSKQDMSWLETLVWPGQEQRAYRLRSAITVAQNDPPKVHHGNLLLNLSDIAAAAPKDAQLVVFHTAVLAYVPTQAERDAFAEIVRRTGAVWISNEAPSVFPEIAKRAPSPPSPGHFLVSINAEPVAWTSPHGQSIDWFK